MSRNPLVIGMLGFASILVMALCGVMTWVAMDRPKSGPFQTQFSLIDDRGQPVHETLFKGNPSLVYFGYTHCPEVCPTTLYEMADWVKALGPQADPLKAYFFTVDPERDTPDVLHEYVNAFSNRITGVTGDPNEVKKVIDGWMIHAAKLPSEDGDYHMKHTVSLLLVGADGRLKGMIPYGTDAEDAIRKIRSLLLR